MRKSVLILTVVFVAVLFTLPAFAEDNQGWQDSGQQGQQGGPGMMGGRGGNGPMKGMGMMGGMMQKDTVVATSDGGVVVMQGPRLLKYDANLTLVKEVELPRGKKPGPAQGQGEGGGEGNPQGGPEGGMPPQDSQPQY